MAATETPVRARWHHRVGVVVLLLTCALTARADDRVSAGAYYYGDDDGLTVWHPFATASVDLDEDTTIDVAYDADVISAATVDVRTSASVRPFTETRHGAAVGVERQLARTLRASSGYALSLSPDYRSHSLGARLSLEDDERNHTVTFGLRGSYDRVGRVWQNDDVGDILTLGASASWAFLLSSEAVVDVSAALEYQRGYLESPYRTVPIYGPSGDSVRVAEEVPDVRLRAAGRARLRFRPASWLFVDARYRLHADDWGVLGHTVDTRVSLEPHERWLVTLGGRFFTQRGASFQQRRYEMATDATVPTLRTMDRELAESHALSGGARLAFSPGQLFGARTTIALRSRATWRLYRDTPNLRERVALEVGSSFTGEW